MSSAASSWARPKAVKLTIGMNSTLNPGTAVTRICVYEETERGGEWRLFTMFEPEYPMTAADAATKRVGDRLNLTGEDVRITLRSASRVYHIEGQAPEGVEVGDVANYFNAEAGNDMQVVSWTGDEVEYYNGVNIPQSVVAAAFNVPRASNASSFSGGDSSWLGGNDEN